MSTNTTSHTLPPESELRLEVPPTTTTASITLKSGSAEIFGAELPPNDRPVPLAPSSKAAVFTWHGAVVEVSDEDKLDIVYVSEETDANVAYVNTHAQLEAMRDEALSSLLPGNNPQSGVNPTADAGATNNVEGPRVLLVGPTDCGKSSIVRTLSSYAVKLSRSPIIVDLDVSQNMLSVPGTIAASPLSIECISAECNATGCSLLNTTTGSTGMPLVLWYGSEDVTAHPELYTAQIDKLAKCIDDRLSRDVDAKSSGIIVNTSGCIEDIGYNYLLHAMDALRINVVLVVGPDRLYSMLGTALKKRVKAEEEALTSMTDAERLVYKKVLVPKLIKLPRSGGVVSRDGGVRRALRSRSIQRYFYGSPYNNNNKAASSSGGTKSAAATANTTQYQFTPSLLEVSFSEIQIHKLSNVSLSASMLPVSSKQSTDPIQLVDVPSSEITTKLQQCVLAVCHPSAVEKYEQSGIARDLYLAGVAGFVAVEKVDVGKERLSLLSPCVGSLPSCHLLLGDVSWLE
jgi:polyribonucleotide 5'-hydroxyl-kinase